jgi:flap endonuclease-1
MGIKNLSSLIQLYAPNSIQKIHFSDLTGKKIAIDASLLIYSYVIAIRNSSEDLTNLDGEMTSHIHAVVSKTLLYLDNGITPIFVFDGKPPNLKNDVLDKRKEERELAKKLMDEIKSDDEYSNDKKIKYFKKSTVITWKQMEQCKEILKAMGIPVIEALEESDSQCAYLTKNDFAYGVGSEDMDILTFGSKKLLRNISSSKKNDIVEYDLQKILNELNYTYQEFIDLCILLGCDYVEHIDGIGIKKAKDIIDEYRTIDNFIKTSNDVKNNKYKIPENYINKYISARDYFLNGPANTFNINQVKLTNPNEKKIKELLINKYSYSKTKVEKIIKKINNS